MAVNPQRFKSWARKFVNTGRVVYGDSPVQAWRTAHQIYGKHLTFCESDFVEACKVIGMSPRHNGDDYILELRT